MADTLSWSQGSTLASCGRQWELSYFHNLEKIPGVDRINQIRGSAFHAGMNAALLNPDNPVGAAVAAARRYLIDNREHDKTAYNWDTREYEADHSYYEMMDALMEEIPPIMRFYVPRIGLGTKYRLAYTSDVFPVPFNDDVPMAEYFFELPFEGTMLTGYVDAILVDLETNDIVMVDWKLRKSFDHPNLTEVDGQLLLYAAVLNQQGANITQVCQWQFKVKLPSPAELSTAKKTLGHPLTGRASYDTIWDVWVDSLPADVNPEDYRAVMEPKMKTIDAFMSPTFIAATGPACQLALKNMQMLVGLRLYYRALLDEGHGLPALNSSYKCQGCEFLALCAGPLRSGGDASELIDIAYQQRRPKEDEHIQDSKSDKPVRKSRVRKTSKRTQLMGLKEPRRKRV